MREKISVCITAYNEEENIRACLESVKWADELIVVDSFSTDSTPKICKEYTDLVYYHRWLGYIEQKNLIRALASHPWVLFIDADEEVSPQLRDEILKEFDEGLSRMVNAYEFPRMVRYLGKWIRHGDWYPDIKLRLFRNDLARCGGMEPHDRVEVPGPIRRLRGPMYHYTHRDIADHLDSLNKYSSIMAKGWSSAGRKAHPIQDLMLRPIWSFVRGYFLKAGFLDGVHGLIIAAINAHGVFTKYAKLWALTHAARLERLK